MKVARLFVLGMTLVASGCYSSSGGRLNDVMDGAAGADGMDGDSASVGVDGNTNTTGMTGTDGFDGATGMSSTSGVDGLTTATDQTDGLDGTTGADGIDSSTGSTGGSGGVGTEECPGIVTCTQSCVPGDNACIQNCISTGTVFAQQQAQALFNCVAQACPTGEKACVDMSFTTSCSAEAQECTGIAGGGGTTGGATGGTTGGGSGSGNGCYATLECTSLCDDTPCVSACLDAMNPNSAAIWNALVQCIQTQCPPTGEGGSESTCVEAALMGPCQSQGLACQSDTANKPGAKIHFEPWMQVYTVEYTVAWIARMFASN